MRPDQGAASGHVSEPAFLKCAFQVIDRGGHVALALFKCQLRRWKFSGGCVLGVLYQVQRTHPRRVNFDTSLRHLQFNGAIPMGIANLFFNNLLRSRIAFS